MPPAVPAIASIGSFATNSTLAAVTIPKPAGLTAGELLIARITSPGNFQTPSAIPTGFTGGATAGLLSTSGTSTAAVSLNVYYAIATAPMVAATDFVWSWAGGCRSSGELYRISGADTTSIFDGTALHTNGDVLDGATLTVSAYTTAAVHSLVFAFAAQLTGSVTSVDFAPPAGYTAAHDSGNVALVATRAGGASAVRDQATAGTVAASSFAASTTGRWATMVVAVRAAVPPAPTSRATVGHVPILS